MSSYPTDVTQIDSWAAQHGVSRGETIRRYVQFVTLQSVASAELGSVVALKGGNALRFVHGGLRSTVDLDYTVIGELEDTTDAIRRAVASVARGFPRYGIKGKVQKVKRNPRGESKTLPTWKVRIGFQMPWDKHYQGFESRDLPVGTVVEIDLSMNDLVCEQDFVQLEGGDIEVCVCSLEDIVAEKLRALLQQVIRKRNRPQDVHDVASIVAAAQLDLGKVADFLTQKCDVRQIQVGKAMFNDEVRGMAKQGYDALADELGDEFIPFDAGWNAVLGLVGRLPIPE